MEKRESCSHCEQCSRIVNGLLPRRREPLPPGVGRRPAPGGGRRLAKRLIRGRGRVERSEAMLSERGAMRGAELARFPREPGWRVPGVLSYAQI